MQCPMCEEEGLRTIKAGISKKTGKHFDTFNVCDKCGYKGQDENGTRNVVVKSLTKDPNPPKPNGIDPSMRQSYRKDLMCEIVKTFASLGGLNKTEAIATFNDLWTVIENE
jgi:hypothetical protein